MRFRIEFETASIPTPSCEVDIPYDDEAIADAQHMVQDDRHGWDRVTDFEHHMADRLAECMSVRVIPDLPNAGIERPRKPQKEA